MSNNNRKHSGNRAMSISVLLIPKRKKSWLYQTLLAERFVKIHFCFDVCFNSAVSFLKYINNCRRFVV